MNDPIIDIHPQLPVRDEAMLRRALLEGDLPTWLMVLTHFERDAAFLERFAPYVGSVFEPPREVPQALAGELRERLFTLLTRDPPPQDSGLPPDRRPRISGCW